MAAKLAKVVFSVECLFFLAFLLMAAPVPGHQFPVIKPSPSLLAFVVVGGYCWLALGLIFYIYGAVGAALGRVKFFWNSFIPPMLGVPILVWGFGKLQSMTNSGVAIGVSLAVVLLAALIEMRTPATRWRALPILLPAVFLLTVDFPMASFSHLLIGALLLTAPIFLSRGMSDTGGSAAP